MNPARPARNGVPLASPQGRQRCLPALLAAAALAACAGDGAVVMKRSPEAAAADAAARHHLQSGRAAPAASLWPGPGYTPYPYPLVDPHRAASEPAEVAAAAPRPERRPARRTAVVTEPAGGVVLSGLPRHASWAMAADGPITAMTAELAPRMTTGVRSRALALDIRRAPASPASARPVALQQPAGPDPSPAVLPTMVSAQG